MKEVGNAFKAFFVPLDGGYADAGFPVVVQAEVAGMRCNKRLDSKANKSRARDRVDGARATHLPRSPNSAYKSGRFLLLACWEPLMAAWEERCEPEPRPFCLDATRCWLSCSESSSSSSSSK